MNHRPTRFNLGTQIPVLLAALFALAMLILTPFWALRWYRQPFLGALFESHGVVSSINSKGWPATEQGVQYLDRLVAINGERIDSVRDFERIISANGYTPVELSLFRPDGVLYSISVTPIPFPYSDFIALFLIPYFIGVAFFGIGMWAYSLRRDRWESRALLLFVSGVAVMTSSLFEISTTRYTNALWGLAILVAAGGLMYLALVFPQPLRWIRAYPHLRLLPWLMMLLLVPMMVGVVVWPSSPYAYTYWWQFGYLVIVLGFLMLVGLLIWRIFRSSSNVVRQQSRIIIFGAILALLPIMLYLAALGLGSPPPFRAWVLFPPMILMPLSITYAILRFRLLDVDRILSRLVAYIITTAIALGLFYGLIAAFSMFLQSAVHAADPLVIAGYLLLLAFGLMPVRNFIQGGIDRFFYRSPADYRRALTTLSRGLVITPDLGQVLSVLEAQLQHSLAPEKFVIYLYNDDLDKYIPHASQEENVPSYMLDDPLIHTMSNLDAPLWLPLAGPLPPELEPAAAKYRHLVGTVFVPLRYEGNLIGFMMLGQRRSGELYSKDDLEFLGAVADQSTLALENARTFVNLRHNLDQTLEMKNLMDDIFASIATGVIITDLKKRIRLFNRAAEHILGIPVKDAIGKPLVTVIPELGRELELVTTTAISKGEIVVSPEINQMLQKRGDVVLRLSCAPLRDAYDETTGAALVFEDLTERRHLETEQERIRQTFGRVVAPRVRDRLLADPGNLRLDGSQQFVTILFADVSGFTSFSERHPPEIVFKILNQYLSLAAQAILEQEGTLDKFMGDAVLAIWNSPDLQADHALRGVRAACALRQRAVDLHRVIDDPAMHMSFRVGIVTGAAMIGNVGTSELFNYTAIGDAVNLAQRLQSSARPGQILLSRGTYGIVKEFVEAKELPPLTVKGRKQAAEIYELIGLKK